MATYTFDPSEDSASPEQQAAETSALEQGEMLAKAAEEDRARRMERSRQIKKMSPSSAVSSSPRMTS